jgi:cytochrome c-type biogenesis protein CcmH/NrfF
MESDYMYDDYLEDDENYEEWHTGQSYEDIPAVQLRCKKCGGNQFNVAQGDYWTGLRCPVCRWETCVHDG